MQANFNHRNLKLIVGLGNPGKKHENTYHNAGHLFIDYLKKNNLQPTTYNLKTDCYMNESGGFVAGALKKYGVKPAELLIAQDDSDIELGKYKLTFGRGAAGHRGVASVIKTLGTNNFYRLRIGSRPQKEKVRKKAVDFVLKKISAKDRRALEKVFAEIILKLPLGRES